MKEFRTSIFEESKTKSRKRLLYNLGIFGAIAAMRALYFFGFPFVGLKTSIGFSIALVGLKLYDDKAMGITAYGDRKDNLVIAEEYLEISDVKIPYSGLTNLVIYVEEYLGMQNGVFGIHHGGNNKIEFDHNGKRVSFNYVIKNKKDYDAVMKLVTGIEKNPSLHMNLHKLG